MGKPMCLNLIKNGFEVTAFNRTRDKMEEVIKAGAREAKSPGEVAAASDIIITIVTDTEDVRDVILGQDGVLSGAARGDRGFRPRPTQARRTV